MVAATASALWRLASTGQRADPQIICRLAALEPALAAQLDASRRTGRDVHSSHHLVEPDVHRRANAARHHGFLEDFSLLSDSDLKVAQRSASRKRSFAPGPMVVDWLGMERRLCELESRVAAVSTATIELDETIVLDTLPPLASESIISPVADDVLVPESVPLQRAESTSHCAPRPPPSGIDGGVRENTIGDLAGLKCGEVMNASVVDVVVSDGVANMGEFDRCSAGTFDPFEATLDDIDAMMADGVSVATKASGVGAGVAGGGVCVFRVTEGDPLMVRADVRSTRFIDELLPGAVVRGRVDGTCVFLVTGGVVKLKYLKLLDVPV